MFIVQIPPVDTLRLMELSRAVEPKTAAQNRTSLTADYSSAYRYPSVLPK